MQDYTVEVHLKFPRQPFFSMSLCATSFHEKLNEPLAGNMRWVDAENITSIFADGRIIEVMPRDGDVFIYRGTHERFAVVARRLHRIIWDNPWLLVALLGTCTWEEILGGRHGNLKNSWAYVEIIDASDVGGKRDVDPKGDLYYGTKANLYNDNEEIYGYDADLCADVDADTDEIPTDVFDLDEADPDAESYVAPRSNGKVYIRG